jgi:hypothetical protein
LYVEICVYAQSWKIGFEKIKREKIKREIWLISTYNNNTCNNTWVVAFQKRYGYYLSFVCNNKGKKALHQIFSSNNFCFLVQKKFPHTMQGISSLGKLSIN